MRPVLPPWAILLVLAILFMAGMIWVRDMPKAKLRPLEDASKTLFDAFGMKGATEVAPEGGVEVGEVKTGSLAAAAGIRAGDRIIACRDLSVWHSAQLLEYVRSSVSQRSPCTLLLANDGHYRVVTLSTEQGAASPSRT